MNFPMEFGMTTKQDFNLDERFTLWKAPYTTALAVIAAQPGGLAAEMIASVKAAVEAREQFKSELMQSILMIEQDEANSFSERVSEEARNGSQFTADDMLAMAIGDVRAALTLLRKKADPTEMDEYRQMVLQRAELVANAGTEGGFLGIGGVRVADAEQRVIDEIRLAVNRVY
jgi:hypothetical protein